MDEKALKTKTWQRVVILIVAILMIGAMMLSYMFIVMGNSGSNSSKNDEELLAQLQEEYDVVAAEVEDKITKPFSEKYFGEFSKYKSEVKAYNSANANAAGLAKTDLKEGTGKTLTEGDTDYLAYYIGWCADGTIFDSSFNMDSNDNPTSLKAPLDPSGGLIEGWNQGVIGMKLGGVRQLTITSDLAYGEQEICGGKNSPLKFVVMPIESDAKYKELSSKLNDLRMQIYYAMYGGMIQ